MEKRKIKDCLKKYGNNSSSYLTVDKKMNYFTNEHLDGYISYGLYHNVVIVLGEPVCKESDVKKLIADFKSFCKKNKYFVCFFGTTEKAHHIFRECGFKILYIGIEPFVELEKFTITSKKYSSIKRGANHAKRVGVQVEECCSVNNETINELNMVSNDWLKTKSTPVLSFMVGDILLDISDRRFFLAKKDTAVQAFGIFNPIYTEKSWYLDTNRRLRNAPNGTMEYLMSESFNILKKEGAKKIYMGLTPLTELDISVKENGILITSLFKVLLLFLNKLYPVKSEWFFKRKFNTGYEKRYLCYWPRISLLMVYGIFKIFCPSGLKGVVYHKLKKMIA